MGVLVLLLGGEMLRWQRQVSRDDELFRATPGRADLWHVPGAPPWDPVKAVLGLDDDLSFREALRLFKAARPRGHQHVRAAGSPGAAGGGGARAAARARERGRPLPAGAG